MIQLVIMTRAAWGECQKLVGARMPPESPYRLMYGLPIDLYDTQEECNMTAVEYASLGKKVLVCECLPTTTK